MWRWINASERKVSAFLDNLVNVGRRYRQTSMKLADDEASILCHCAITRRLLQQQTYSYEGAGELGSIKSAPPPNPKKSAHMLKLWAYYGLSNPARKKFWALFSNEKTIIEKWGC